MHAIATDRAAVLRIVGEAAEAFHQRGDGVEVSGLEEVSPPVAAVLSKELRAAAEWAESPDGRDEEADEVEGDDDYVSHDPVISLVQAALDEHADDAGDDAPGADLTVSRLAVIGQTLQARTSNHLPFIPPKSVGDFTFDLPSQCRVVLVGDWGTAKRRARKVARAIAATNPDHIIHLGDIYPSGTRSRARKRFIEVWQEEVGEGPRYWAMVGNHEMNANGEGYFLDVLPFCGQEASFFCLRNEHWKLIALDSAYRNWDLEPAQLPWLQHQLGDGPGNNIVLTHHQVFSAVDPRPKRNEARLAKTMAPFVESGRIFAWFWGHEHRFLSYARDPRFGNYLARAIGHGGKRIRRVDGVHLGPDMAPPVVHYWNIARPGQPDACLNGFALLTFDGPELTLEYFDEEGRAWFLEIWPHSPHA